MGRDFGLTSKWNSSPSVRRLAISGITRVQNQWAPDGLAGSSVRRLIATRIVPSEGGGGDVARSHPGLPYVLGEQVHAGLMGVLDDPVVVRADVHGHRRDLPRRTAGKPGEGNSPHPVLIRPFQRSNDVRR